MKTRLVQHRPTRSDVAARAGVSKTTVTYALGNNYTIAIPEATRQRVKQAAQELGYRPNAIAQALVSGRTHTATIAFNRTIAPFYAQMLQTFERSTNEHGYHLIASTICHAGPDSIAADFASLLSGPNDAIILVDMAEEYADDFAAFLPTSKALISMGINLLPDMDCVHVDLLQGARSAMQHLLAGSPKRLALYSICPPEALASLTMAARAGVGDPRMIAYCQEMDAAGMPLEIIAHPPGRRRLRIDNFKEYAQARGCPDAVLCFTDDLAVCAHRALRELGFRLPDDVRLVGCDGIEECESLDPQITTIVQPVDTMCAEAWRLAEARLADPTAPFSRITLVPELIIRGSSAM